VVKTIKKKDFNEILHKVFKMTEEKKKQVLPACLHWKEMLVAHLEMFEMIEKK
jgi:hypothetical protein